MDGRTDRQIYIYIYYTIKMIMMILINLLKVTILILYTPILRIYHYIGLGKSQCLIGREADGERQLAEVTVCHLGYLGSEVLQWWWFPAKEKSEDVGMHTLGEKHNGTVSVWMQGFYGILRFRQGWTPTLVAETFPPWLAGSRTLSKHAAKALRISGLEKHKSVRRRHPSQQKPVPLDQA